MTMTRCPRCGRWLNVADPRRMPPHKTGKDWGYCTVARSLKDEAPASARAPGVERNGVLPADSDLHPQGTPVTTSDASEPKGCGHYPHLPGCPHYETTRDASPLFLHDPWSWGHWD